jgi:mono/diheme cytochrome c family protein
MRVGKTIALAAMLTTAGALLAQNKNYTPDPTWKAPAAAARKPNPLAKLPNAAKEGKMLFDAQCSMCHGADGTGVADAANLHLRDVQEQSDGMLFWKITTGNQHKGMPSFQRLPEKERWQLVSYLRTFKGK